MLLKKLIFIAPALLAFTYQKPTEPTTLLVVDLKYELLNGRVKQLVEMVKKQNKNDYDTVTTTFDKDGNLVSQRMKYGIYHPMISFGVRYDKDQRKIVSRNLEGKVRDEATYEPDPQKRLAKVTLRDTHGNVTATETFSYDTQGNMIERNFYAATGNFLIMKVNSKYDDKGKLVEEQYGRPDDKMGLKINYKYEEFDSKNNWIRAVRRGNLPGQAEKEPVSDTVIRQIAYY